MPAQIQKMESPADYLDSPMDGDDMAYPCKGCGDVSLWAHNLLSSMLTCFGRYLRKARLLN